MLNNLSRHLKLYVGRHLFSIHRFLVITLLCILTITISSVAFLNYWQIIKQNKNILQMQLSTSSQILDSLINIQISEDKSNQLSSLLNKSAKETIANFLEDQDKQPKNLLISYKHQMIFQVWDLKKNKIIIKSSNAPDKSLSSKDNNDQFHVINVNKNEWYSYTRVNKQKNIKIIFAINEAFHHKINTDIFFHDLTILFIVYLVMALCMMLIVNYSLRPLVRITKDLSTRDADNLSMLNMRGTPIEIRPLIREINNLFRKVNSSIDREKGFTADAAHELKTPLAALKTQVQVAIRERNDLKRTHILRNIIIGTNRCTHVIEQLLILSHIEPKEALSNAKEFSLTDVTHELMAEMAYSAIEKNVELSLSCGKIDPKTDLPIDKFSMLGNSIMISILLRNLIDNAIRYTPEKGSVSVVISRSEDQKKIILNVIDTGPGIPDDIKIRVFDRFFRKLGNKESGTGLGLSIVKQVLRLHDAKIQVLSPESGKGTKMQVTFKTLSAI